MIKHSGVPYWRLSGFYFLFFVTVGIFLPYWSLYLKAIGFDAKVIGILSATVVVTKIFTTYVWGWMVDYSGKRMRVIQVASLLSAVSFSGALFVQDFWGLFVILILFSIFWSASLPQIEAATLTHLGESTHAYTRIRVWGSVGFIITVWLTGIILEIVSIQYVPVLLLSSMVIVWLMSLTVPEMQSGTEASHTDRVREILVKPSVLALLVICFLMLVSHGPYYTFFSIYLEDNGYSSSIIGQLWAVGVIAEIVLFLFMHRLRSIVNLRWLLLSSLLLAVIRWLVIAFFVNHYFLLVIAQLLHAATFGVYHVAAIQYIHQHFRGRLQGRGQALYSSVSFGAGMAFGSLVSGYMWDWAGAASCFTGAAVTAALAFVIAWFLLKD